MLKIEHIKEHSNAITRIAQWHHEEWSYLNPERSVMEREAELYSHLDRSRVPETFVALVDDEIVGCASLVEHDMGTHHDLGPWLASVYVQPKHRGVGIGKELVQFVTGEARALGYRKLYLYSLGLAKYYEQQGWTVYAEEQYHEYLVSVMQHNFSAN